MACEELKKERSAEMVEEKARVIYEDYVSILSPREVIMFLLVHIQSHERKRGIRKTHPSDI